MPRATALLALGVLPGALGVMTSCDRDRPTPGAATSSPVASAPAGKVDLVAVPRTEEPLPHVFKRELARARADGRDLVVYVGATWCEPCKYFHDAVTRGELDAAFPTLRLLELDLDRDGRRLTVAGCQSAMIPLFAALTDEGTCDPSRRVFGSVKGPGAVDNLVPRLKAMLGHDTAAR